METLITKDYSRFNFLPYNRNIRRDLVEIIKEDIKKCGYRTFEPIFVDKSYAIGDGQHRFTACKELGLPVYYQIVVDAFTPELVVKMNNTRKQWELIDNTRAISLTTNPSYRYIVNLVEKYGISAAKASHIYFAANRMDQNTSRKFKTGECLFTNEGYNNACVLVEQLVKLKEYHRDRVYTSCFVGAFLKAVNTHNFDFKKFLKALDKDHMENCSTVGAYCREIERVYNRCQRGKNKKSIVIDYK